MDHYCKSPWMSLFVYNDGKVKSCCAGQWDWGDLKKNTLEEIVNSPKVVELRKDIAEGRHNSYCDYCKGCEENAGEGQRKYFDKFIMTDEELYNPELFDLRMVDMRWNNLCNLNCVYCDGLWSTTWQKAKGLPMSDLKTNHYVSVLDSVKTNSNKMEAIIMGGGEPLLHTQNVELLQSLAPDIHIDIMTNLSTNLSHSAIFAELKKKTRVNWCVSFENVGEQFEFVRHGASWDRMTTNLNLVKSLPTHSRMFKPTYNILCATSLISLYELLNEVEFDVHWQTLIHPQQLNVLNFSPKVLDLCIETIDKLFDSDAFKKHSATPKCGQDKDFFLHVKKELLEKKTQSYNYMDKEFREWITNYNKKYASDVRSFEELWPDLDNVMEK
jgi:MoaA/NifB/PqqE/SkfB family radical SAM enzyme